MAKAEAGVGRKAFDGSGQAGSSRAVPGPCDSKAPEAGLSRGLAAQKPRRLEGATLACSIRVTRMEVHRGHLVCLVSFADAPRVTSAPLMGRVLREFPTLPRHACVNERGTTFAAVMNCTPLPHLLEHLVVDLQVRAQLGKTCDSPVPADRALSPAGSPDGLGPRAGLDPPERPIVGTSEWVDEGAGIARIDVSFADDQVALRAFRDAVAFLNETLQDLRAEGAGPSSA